MFLEYLEQEIKMLEKGISWAGLDEIKERILSKSIKKKANRRIKKMNFIISSRRFVRLLWILMKNQNTATKK